MSSLKQIRKIKQRGAFFFEIGGLLALIAAAKLAPPVHQAKVQPIGGEHAKQIATQIAKDFLLYAGAVDPQTWVLHLSICFMYVHLVYIIRYPSGAFP